MPLLPLSLNTPLALGNDWTGFPKSKLTFADEEDKEYYEALASQITMQFAQLVAANRPDKVIGELAQKHGAYFVMGLNSWEMRVHDFAFEVPADVIKRLYDAGILASDENGIVRAMPRYLGPPIGYTLSTMRQAVRSVRDAVAGKDRKSYWRAVGMIRKVANRTHNRLITDMEMEGDFDFARINEERGNYYRSITLLVVAGLLPMSLASGAALRAADQIDSIREGQRRLSGFPVPESA